MERDKSFNSYASTGYQSAIATAIAAGVFALIIASLLSVHVYHYKITDPSGSMELEKLKDKARLNPSDQSLSQEILTFDTRLRRDQLARQQFLRRGTLLLLSTLALCVGSIIIAGGYSCKLKLPKPESDTKFQQIMSAQRTRTSLTCLLAIMGAGSLFWSMYSPQPQDSSATASQPTVSPQQDADISFASMEEMNMQWPCFRGPGGLGIYNSDDSPTEWDESVNRNIIWKSPVSMTGHSSPVAWGQRIFLTGADESSRLVFCFNADDGGLLWSKDILLSDDPAYKDLNIGEDTGFAAPTPVTDGRRVCAIFAGGEIGCFTVDGTELWQKHLGVPDSMYGYASSLAAFEDVVIVQWDVSSEEGQSKLMALNWQTGQIVWQTPRPVPNSWSSPTVALVGEKYMVLTAASPYVISYDPKTGAEIFRAECVDGDIAATPIIANGTIITMEPYQKLVAISAANASGDITETNIAWQAEGSMPDICSPVSDGKSIWTLTSDGKLGCYNLSDGSEIYTQGLELMFQASPVLAGGRLYLLAQDGTMVIADTASQYKEIRRNSINDQCTASPAFAAGRIYIRGKENLYCIGTVNVAD